MEQTITVTNEDMLVCDLVATKYFNITVEEFYEVKKCEELHAVYYTCDSGSLIIDPITTQFLYAESFIDFDFHLEIFKTGLRSSNKNESTGNYN